MNRKNSIVIPCLIIGELFTIYVSYVLNGVWNTNGDIVLILNKFNAAIKNPFGHYYNANTLRAVIYGSLIYGMAVLMYVTSRRNLMHGKEYVQQDLQTYEWLIRHLQIRMKARIEY